MFFPGSIFPDSVKCFYIRLEFWLQSTHYIFKWCFQQILINTCTHFKVRCSNRKVRLRPSENPDTDFTRGQKVLQLIVSVWPHFFFFSHGAELYFIFSGVLPECWFWICSLHSCLSLQMLSEFQVMRHLQINIVFPVFALFTLFFAMKAWFWPRYGVPSCCQLNFKLTFDLNVYLKKKRTCSANASNSCSDSVST